MTTLRSGEPTGARRLATWSGWLAFAALIMFLDGCFNVIDGLVALFKDRVYVQGPDGLVVFNFTAWGWILLIIGVVQIVVALALRTGALWARLTALGILLVSAIAQMAFITAYPIWSVLVIALDVLVMWAILVYIPQPDA